MVHMGPFRSFGTNPYYNRYLKKWLYRPDDERTPVSRKNSAD